MIPIKLQIKNFLSYGSDVQEVNFEPYSMICLSGKNGHGKSALLDAMTWSIWGQARKINSNSKPDQGLLRLGQRQMMVIFDFAFNGQVYRVRREYTAAYGKQYAYLDFGIMQDNSPEITMSLTGKTIRETQDKIISILGLDYESFINSAFLRQGQSNEFSRKSPKERKEVLCSILGLDRFENLKKLAFEKTKDFISQKDTYLKIQQRIESELANVDAINTLFLQTDHDLKELVAKEVLQHEAVNFLQEELKELQLKIQEHNNITAQIKDLTRQSTDIKSVVLTDYKIWKSCHLKLLSSRDKKYLENIKSDLLSKFYAEQKKIDNLLLLKNQQIALRDTEHNLRSESQSKYQLLVSNKNRELDTLNLNRDSIFQKITFLDSQILDSNNKLSSSKSLADKLNQDISKYKKLDISKNETIFEHRKEFYQYLINSGNLLTKQLAELDSKGRLSLNKENPNCPFCKQNLSQNHIESLSGQIKKEELFVKVKLARIRLTLPQLKELLVREHEVIKQYRHDEQECGILQVKLNQEVVKISELEKELEMLNSQKASLARDLDVLEKSIEIHKISLVALEKESVNGLACNAEYQKILSDLEAINKEILGFDQVQLNFENLRKSIDAVDLELQKLDLLKHEKELQKERIQKISNSIVAYKICKIKLLELEHKLLGYVGVFDQEALTKNKLNLVVQELKIISEQKQKLTHQRGGLEAQMQKLSDLSKEHKDNLNIVSNLDREIQDFKDITLALGKEGIQALLIEEAIPEIEQEANLLLSRLTDNQAQIFIESLRDLKKGGTKETLDIKISDSAGIRDYEMFSGGEAFRIDFAIRIAISKLLARRAGTSLQTLIIDEGFGSQDDEGLTNIMDSLYKIQSDFEKIIIVSHLPSMKDQFPVHFVVRKGPAGSCVEVFEQG